MASLGYPQIEFMSREMASLTRANIPLPEGLRKMAGAATTGRIREAYRQIAMALEQGHPLSGAMAGASAPPEFVAAIQCAEVSGDMADVLEYAIEHCRRVDQFYGKLSNIALYPVIVFSIVAPILTLLSVAVVPKFESIFAEVGADLSFLTRSMIELSHLLRHGWGIGVLIVSALIFIWACSPLFMRGMPFLLQRLPFFKELLMLSDLAMLMRFFERMLRRGLPFPVVLRAASLAVWGRTLRARLITMAVQAEQGMMVIGSLQGLIPPLPLHLLEQAEQRGDLIDTCPGVARYCEDRFGLRAESHLRRFEPILIVILGVIVGAIIISLYMPLFNIPKLIGKG